MTFPAKLREIIGERFIVTKGLDGCLFVYSLEDFEVRANKIKALPMAQGRNLQRSFMANASEVEADKQGRILIPSVLREFAALEKDVVFVGVGSRIEIWNRAGWDESISGYDDDMDEVAENMDSLGFTI